MILSPYFKLFQFQYGAIKGKLPYEINYFVKQFQFQYGAIKGRHVIV